MDSFIDKSSPAFPSSSSSSSTPAAEEFKSTVYKEQSRQSASTQAEQRHAARPPPSSTSHSPRSQHPPLLNGQSSISSTEQFHLLQQICADNTESFNSLQLLRSSHHLPPIPAQFCETVTEALDYSEYLAMEKKRVENLVHAPARPDLRRLPVETSHAYAARRRSSSPIIIAETTQKTLDSSLTGDIGSLTLTDDNASESSARRVIPQLRSPPPPSSPPSKQSNNHSSPSSSPPLSHHLHDKSPVINTTSKNRRLKSSSSSKLGLPPRLDLIGLSPVSTANTGFIHSSIPGYLRLHQDKINHEQENDVDIDDNDVQEAEVSSPPLDTVLLPTLLSSPPHSRHVLNPPYGYGRPIKGILKKQQRQQHHKAEDNNVKFSDVRLERIYFISPINENDEDQNQETSFQLNDYVDEEKTIQHKERLPRPPMKEYLPPSNPFANAKIARSSLHSPTITGTSAASDDHVVDSVAAVIDNTVDEDDDQVKIVNSPLVFQEEEEEEEAGGEDVSSSSHHANLHYSFI